VTATVTLDGPAPAGGAVVTIAAVGAEKNALILPASMTINRGDRTAAILVRVSSSGVSSAAEVTITATYGGVTKSVVLRLQK